MNCYVHSQDVPGYLHHRLLCPVDPVNSSSKPTKLSSQPPVQEKAATTKTQMNLTCNPSGAVNHQRFLDAIRQTIRVHKVVHAPRDSRGKSGNRVRRLESTSHGGTRQACTCRRSREQRSGDRRQTRRVRPRYACAAVSMHFRMGFGPGRESSCERKEAGICRNQRRESRCGPEQHHAPRAVPTKRHHHDAQGGRSHRAWGPRARQGELRMQRGLVHRQRPLRPRARAMRACRRRG